MESKVIHKKTILNKNFFDVHNDGTMMLHNVEVEISSRYENDEFDVINSTEIFYLQVTTRNKTSVDFIDCDEITDEIILEWLFDEIKKIEMKNSLLIENNTINT